MYTQTVKDRKNHILGYIEIDDEGNKTAYNFYRKILGSYKKSQDITYDFYMRIVAYGDATSALIFENEDK